MTDLKVAVVDYESGNLHSVGRALEKAGVPPMLTADPEVVLQADAVVLPGVGAGDSAMKALHQRKLVEPLRRVAAEGRPLLCICLGLQLLMDETEEGPASCLGIVPGVTRRLPSGLKVPHMGWNQVTIRTSHPLMKDIPDGSNFYFVHSYYADPLEERVVAGVTDYGTTFCSILVKDNVMAAQFHPEKSGPVGLKVYQNFIDYSRQLLGTGPRAGTQRV